MKIVNNRKGCTVKKKYTINMNLLWINGGDSDPTIDYSAPEIIE